MKRIKMGFTFIEIIIAMTVLVVGILGILSLFPVGIKASAMAVNLTKATFLAQIVMEEIKRDGYDSLVNLEDVPSTDYPGFSYDVAWEDVSGVTNLRSVTVTIEWTKGDTTRSRNFVSYISRR